MPTTAELIQSAREKRRKAQLKAQEARIESRNAREEFLAKVQAERQRIAEQAQKAEQQGQRREAGRQQEGPAGPSLPFTQINTQNAPGNVPQDSFSRIEEAFAESAAQAPPQLFAEGGRGVQQAQGAPQGQPTPAPTAPPFLTSQRTTTETGSRQLGSLVVPTRRTRTSTQVEPNQLTAAQALQARQRAQQARFRRQLAEREFLREQRADQASVFRDTLEVTRDPRAAQAVSRAFATGNINAARQAIQDSETWNRIVEQRFRAAEIEMDATAALAEQRRADATSVGDIDPGDLPPVTRLLNLSGTSVPTGEVTPAQFNNEVTQLLQTDNDGNVTNTLDDNVEERLPNVVAMGLDNNTLVLIEEKPGFFSKVGSFISGAKAPEGVSKDSPVARVPLDKAVRALTKTGRVDSFSELSKEERGILGAMGFTGISDEGKLQFRDENPNDLARQAVISLAKMVNSTGAGSIEELRRLRALGQTLRSTQGR